MLEDLYINKFSATYFYSSYCLHATFAALAIWVQAIENTLYSYRNTCILKWSDRHWLLSILHYQVLTIHGFSCSCWWFIRDSRIHCINPIKWEIDVRITLKCIINITNVTRQINWPRDMSDLICTQYIIGKNKIFKREKTDRS